LAQWIRQFTGNTHETKVEDIESSLTKAIEQLRSVADKEMGKWRKSVFHLAERLLAARIKMMKVRISNLKPLASPKDESKKLNNLEDRKQRLEEEGLQGIFIEFGIEDLMKK